MCRQIIPDTKLHQERVLQVQLIVLVALAILNEKDNLCVGIPVGFKSLQKECFQVMQNASARNRKAYLCHGSGHFLRSVIVGQIGLIAMAVQARQVAMQLRETRAEAGKRRRNRVELNLFDGWKKNEK